MSSKPIYFAESKISDLFRPGWGSITSASHYAYDLRKVTWFVDHDSIQLAQNYFDMDRDERVYVGGTMYASGVHKSNKRRMTLYVRPTNKLIKWLSANMIGMADDRIYFDATMRDNGETLISATYNTIIGSRWLLVLPTTDFMEFINR